VSFLWGAIVFSEDIKNWKLTILGLVFLLVGIGGVSLCNQQWKVSLPGWLSFLYKLIPCFVRPHSASQAAINSSETGEERSSTLPSTEDANSPSSTKPLQSAGARFIAGFFAAAFLGVLNGSMMVPAELTPEDDQGLAYAVSFAVGVAIVTIIDAPIYFAIQYFRGKGLPKFHFKVAAIPGIIAGLIWNVGNICSIVATLYLGMTIGFPLTQMALLVLGFWGMVLFKEVTRIPAIISFFASACVLLGGAVLLSLYG
jgi:hypothetical protein